MNNLQFEGTITAVLPKRSGTNKTTGKEWECASFVVSEEGTEYPNSMVFSCFKQEQFPSIVLGRKAIVKFDSKAREYNGKYYQDINAYSVTSEAIAGNGSQAPAPPENIEVFPVNAQDDLPF